MIVDLKRYFLHDTSWESMDLSLDFSDVLEEGEPIFSGEAKADIQVRGFAGAVSLKAKVAYTLEKPCDRCYTVTRHDFSREFAHTLVQSLSGGEPDGDEYVLAPDGKADLAELLREDVLLDLPGKYLCREDCKGLCPKCGKNLNEGECGCDRREIDPRLAALQELL